MKKTDIKLILITYMLCLCTLCSCAGKDDPSVPSDAQPSVTQPSSAPSSAESIPEEPVTYRDNTPVCLVPSADGAAVTQNDVACIDYSNIASGYVCASYTGTCPKVKLRISSPDGTVYTYNLNQNGYETFPLSCGNGSYEVTIYENISGSNYATCLHQQFDVVIEDEFLPFLYPNQYVNFTADSLTVAKGAELAYGTQTDMDVISNIYDYITSTITYDEQKASDPPTGYVTDVDEILTNGTGICLDYAAVMTSMLRSQQIPTRLEVGYAKDAYHAWISVYTAETGWLNGIIEFNGQIWTLVDPTFGANSSESALKKFIGDGSNYVTQKMY